MGAGLNAPITVQWRVQGVTSLEVEVKGMTMPGFDCPAGDMTSVRPVASVSQQFPLSIPQGSMPLAFGMPGYYLFTFYIEKTDGSKIRVMRHANVACDKQAN